MKPSNTHCETELLDWSGSFLPRAVRFLCDQHFQDGCLDLSGQAWVVSTQHAAARLAKLIQQHAKGIDSDFWPPRIMTTGDLPELLYQPNAPTATDFEQTLAWAEVLRNQAPESRRALVPDPPASDLIDAWLDLGSTLRRLNEEVSAAELNFADVAFHAETESEKQRWAVLTDLQTQYLSVIERASLSDPHHGRRQAVLDDKCESDLHIVLIGTVDLSGCVVSMLRGLSSSVQAIVPAPKSHADRFNEYGCLEVPKWLDYKLSFTDEHFIQAGDIADQAATVTEVVAEIAPSYLAEQVNVGVTDESQVGPVELQLRGCDVPTYRNMGWSVSQTALGRLFGLAASHLQRDSWRTLSALVRHADVHRFVHEKLEQDDEVELDGDWLVDLDNLMAGHYPSRTVDALPKYVTKTYPIAAKAAALVHEWLSPFRDDEKTISQWCETMTTWIETLYGEETNDDTAPSTRTAKAHSAVRAVLKRFHKLSHQLDVDVTGSVALEMLHTRLGEVRIADTHHDGDISLLGWLDLPIDDVKATVVVGFNHPFVPSAVTSDPFLPGNLRTKLRMADNDRRYARDVFATELLIQSRECVRFVIGSNSADGSPTPPSRLVAAAEPEDTARRIRLLNERRETASVSHQWDSDLEASNLPIPALNPTPDAVQHMSVTAFRDYLICPYRFYLRHVLRIRPIDDANSELAANQFGDLVHGALEWYGESDDKLLTDPVKIERAMVEHLHEYADKHFGKGAASAVKLQVLQAERRLKFVAKEQAKRIAAGWQIHKTEASVRESATETSDAATIDVDGKSMGVRGRFDRIDHHPDSGRWAILDYKTHGHKPEKKHLRRTKTGQEWIDLQLPLYRMLIPFLGIDSDPDDVELGYFNVAEKPTETRVNIASFSDSLMEEAEETIRQIIRDIWMGKFDPTSDRVAYDDYEMILQTRVPQRMLNLVEQGEGDLQGAYS